MNERRCKNCKHFDQEDFDRHNNGDFGPPYSGFATCKKIPHSADLTEWDDDMNNVLKKEFKDTTAFAADASGYHASLMVHPTFGCTMFEER